MHRWLQRVLNFSFASVFGIVFIFGVGSLVGVRQYCQSHPESLKTGAHTLRYRGEVGEKLTSPGSATGGHVRRRQVRLPPVIGER